MQHNKTKKRGPVAQLDRASGYGPEGWGFDSLRVHHLILCGGVAQLVERRTENPCVAGPIPALATTFFKPVFRDTDFFRFHAQNSCWIPLFPPLFSAFRQPPTGQFCYSALFSRNEGVSPSKLDTGFLRTKSV